MWVVNLLNYDNCISKKTFYGDIMSEYKDITIKKTTLEVIGEKALSIVFIIGVAALTLGALNMMNDGKSESQIRIESSQQ